MQHKISTTGGSAGGGEIHYLTWVYHALAGNAARCELTISQMKSSAVLVIPTVFSERLFVVTDTPVSMVYTMAQLDYPVQNMLDKVWGLWVDDVGADTKLSQILSYADCPMIIGNPWCDANSKQTDPPGVLCNQTWQKASLARYCNDQTSFNAATLGQVKSTQVFPQVTEQDKGLATLW